MQCASGRAVGEEGVARGRGKESRYITTVETKLGVAVRTKRGGATSLGLCTGNIGRADVGCTI